MKKSKYYKSTEHLENAKNAFKKATEKNKLAKLERIKEYETNPNFCTNCKSILGYDKRHNKFCSQSCSASYSNEKRGRCKETKQKISNALRKNPISVENVCKNCNVKFVISWKKKKSKILFSKLCI